jgi:hypothetical protein
MLQVLGNGPWADFYCPATTPNEISLRRPFYPMRPLGSKRHLLDALGFQSAQELLRLCDGPTATRANACEMFWTLGAKQVGRAAIHGWRDLLAPAVRDGSISIWPFDGELSALLSSGGIAVLASTNR